LPTTFVRDSRRSRCLSPHSLVVSPPRGTSMLSPPNTTTRTPAISVLSELNHAASALAVYASQPASQQTTQDSLVSWWPTFAARDWLPAGLLSRFQLFITSSLAKLSWRNVFAQYPFRSARGDHGMLCLQSIRSAPRGATTGCCVCTVPVPLRVGGPWATAFAQYPFSQTAFELARARASEGEREAT